jgi:NADH-quinone oxidoreductase subunit E
MSILDKYPQEVKNILAKYPADQARSAVMPLLHLVQRHAGHVDRHAMQDIAEAVGITETEVASLVGFYTLYHNEPAGKLRIQVCVDLPCALRGADEFLAKLCKSLGIEAGGSTPDGMVTVEPVMCLAACDKAPMFQVQDEDGISYHEHMTVEKTLELVEMKRKDTKGVQS